MPRKKDGMKFELLPRPTKGDDGRPLLYARPAIRHNYALRYIDDYCNKYRGMASGELTRALEVLFGVGAMLMQDGSRIETPLGSFGLKLKLDGDYTDPDKVKGRNVSFSGIEFTPSKRFLKEVEGYIDSGFRKSVDLSRKQTLVDDSERIEKLRSIAERKGYITISAFAYHCGIKYTSAREWLNRHCEGETPLLRQEREGHMVHYLLTDNKKGDAKERDARRG